MKDRGRKKRSICEWQQIVFSMKSADAMPWFEAQHMYQGVSQVSGTCVAIVATQREQSALLVPCADLLCHQHHLSAMVSIDS
jgi:hypothetical protein